MIVKSNGAAVVSDETQADWNCWQVCCVTPAGRSATAGEGTPPPVMAVAVETGSWTADVPGAIALGLVPVVWEMLKVSLPLGSPPAAGIKSERGSSMGFARLLCCGMLLQQGDDYWSCSTMFNQHRGTLVTECESLCTC